MLAGLVLSAELVVVWAFAAALSLGCGMLVTRPRTLTTKGAFLNFWLGLAVWVFVLQAAHLFMPIGPVVGALIFTLGLAGLVLHAGTVRAWLGASRWWTRPTAWIAIAAVLWIANRAGGPPSHIDAQSYHLHAVEWAIAYPAVPGLANLHDRLGFNNCTHLLAALFEGTLFRGESHHIVNGLLLAVPAAYIVGCVGAVLRGTKRWWLELFYPVVATPIAGLALSTNVSSSTTDPAALMFALAGTWCVVELMLAPRTDPAGSQGASPTRSMWYVSGVAMLGLAVCAKLSTLPMAFLLVVGATLFWLLSRSTPMVVRRRAAVAALMVATGLGATWAARSVILSGYLMYPSTAGNLDLPWAVPLAQAEIVQAVVYADARKVDDINAAELRNWAWFTPWLVGQIRSINVLWVIAPLLMTGAMFAAVSLMGGETRRSLARSAWRLCPLLLALAVAGVAWFVLAPMPRMGSHIFWSLAGATAVAAAAAMSRQSRPWRAAVVAAALAPVGLPFAGAVAFAPGEGGALERVASAWFVAPTPEGRRHPVPAPEHATFRNQYGVEIAVPLQTTGLWGRPLMSTPFPSFRLAMRDPGDLSRGFYTRSNAGNAVDADALRDTLAMLREEFRPGDTLVLNAAARAALADAIALGEVPVSEDSIRVGTLAELPAIFSSLRGHGRTWTVFADPRSVSHEDEMQSAMYLLEAIGPKLAQTQTGGLSVFLHDLQ